MGWTYRVLSPMMQSLNASPTPLKLKLDTTETFPWLSALSGCSLRKLNKNIDFWDNRLKKIPILTIPNPLCGQYPLP